MAIVDKGKIVLLFLGILTFACSAKNKNEQANENILTDSTEKTLENDPLSKFNSDMPVYQYYEKVPRMSGVTNDRENLIFNLKIDLGYKVGDVKTLEKLSKFGIKIAGEIRQDMATKTKVYLGNLDNRQEIENDILSLINKMIAPDPNDEARITDVIIVELFLYDYR